MNSNTVMETISTARDEFYKRNYATALYAKDSTISSLISVGQIRTDINQRTFLVGNLYYSVYKLNGNSTDKLFLSYDELRDAERYEDCQKVTDERFFEIVDCIKRSLEEPAANHLLLNFGLADGTKWTYGEIAHKYGLTNHQVRQSIRRSLHKLTMASLPPLI